MSFVSVRPSWLTEARLKGPNQTNSLKTDYENMFALPTLAPRDDPSDFAFRGYLERYALFEKKRLSDRPQESNLGPYKARASKRRRGGHSENEPTRRERGEEPDE